MNLNRKCTAKAFASCAAFALAVPVSAQTQPAAGAPANDQSAPSGEAQPGSDTTTTQSGPEAEIIIIGTKRNQPAREIAGSVSVLTGAELDRVGAETMEDYLTRTPGVVFNASTPGGSTIVVRGITTTTGQDQGQATTGIFINDVPLTDPTLSIGTPDIDAFDVDNVTVLRGPQGTLFGSSSLGGAVNYIAARPNTRELGAHLQTTFRSSAHGDPGGAGKIMVNVPLMQDKLAVRGVFVYRRDGGFIDNLGIDDKDSNRTTVEGGRALVRFTPTDGTTLDYMYLKQVENTRDVGYIDPTLDRDYAKSTAFAERARFETEIHNLRVDQDVGFGILTATATHHKKKADGLIDLTAALAPALFGLGPSPSYNPGKSSGHTFEVRLASRPGGPLEYVVGAMYDKTRMDQKQVIYTAGLADFLDVFGPLLGLPADMGDELAPDDLLVDASLPAVAREKALFGELSYHFTPQWEVTIGGRAFDQKLKNGASAFGPFVLLTSGEYTSDQSGTQSSSGFSPKASLTWKPTDDLMIYGLVSKGFRFGGANLAALPGIPSMFESDSLWNYEVGTRADLWDRKLLLDVTGFYIDWSNIQVRQQRSGVNYADNAGDARVYGVEASATLRPAKGWLINSNITYLDGAIAEPYDQAPGDDSNAIVPSGTRLPGAARWQVSNVIGYDWAAGPFAPNFVFSHRYISKSPSQLSVNPTYQGGYNLFDARIGFQSGRAGLTLFADNITDKKGVTNSSSEPTQLYIVRPSTVGITLDYRL